jgi:hypothetical protein
MRLVPIRVPWVGNQALDADGRRRDQSTEATRQHARARDLSTRGSSGEFDLLLASRLTQPVKGELLKGDCYLYSTVAWRMSNQAGRDRPYAGHLGRASWTIGRVHTSALHNNG